MRVMADSGGRVLPYVPRLTLEWLAQRPQDAHTLIAGTVIFADLSGFTAMAERLASLGREGAERLTEVIDETFATLLAGVYAEGGRLLAFGGDAMVLMFVGDDHVSRGCRAAVGLRRTLRQVGRHETPRGAVQLRISIGVHTGEFAAFLVGSSHRQLLLAGPGITSVVDAEHAAHTGEIVVTEGTASALPSRCVGPVVAGGYRLSRAPSGAGAFAIDQAPPGAADLAGRAVPTAIRDHLLDPSTTAEHRVVTMAFLQVRGTDTAVAKGLPEAADALAAVVTCVQEACERFGVTFLGADVDHDAVKVLLVAGAPVSRGDDEERMLLALRDVVEARLPLPVRAGVHRGNVFVGDVGPSYRRTFTAMGDTVNLAARLMARADDGTILATHDVVDRSRVTFALTDVEPFVAKGKRALVHAVSVGEATEAVAASSRAPVLVGRDAELVTLLSAWEEARAGRGRAVEIVGEPGIGKTALLDVLVDRASAAAWLRTRGDLYSASSPYRAARELLLTALGVDSRSLDPTELMAGVAQLVSRSAPALTAWLPLLADVVGGSVETTPEVAALSDERRRDRLHEVVTEVVDAAIPGAALLTVEDTHWLDDASSALLAHLVQASRVRPWLVVTTRRDLVTGYVQATGAGEVVIPRPLDDAAAALLATGDDDAVPLPPVVMARLTRQAAGNPLFLRELVAAARDHADVDELPDTLDALLTVRLDRLGARDRDLVRRAAVLGPRFREVDLGLVAGEQTTVPGASSWGRLGEFVVRVDDEHLAFTHALLRDAAYAALPFRLRRELHGRVADAWSTTSERGDDAVLSYHFFAAGRWAEAWNTARVAGEAAVAAYAPVEAAALLDRALQAARLLHGEVAWAERAEVSLLLARAHAVSGSFDAAERAYAGVTAGSDDPLLKARSLVQQAWLAERQSRLRLGVRRARAAQRLLTTVADDSSGRRECLAAALTAEGMCWEVMGRHDRAADALRQAVDEAEAVGDQRTVAHAGSILDGCLAMTGDRTAGRHLERSLEIYQELGDLAGQATCLTNLGALAYLRGDWELAVSSYREGQLVQLRSGDVTSAALGAVNIGEVRSDQGHWEQAMVSLDEALAVWRSTGHRHGVAYAQGLRGRLLARRGAFDAGWDELAAASALHREVGAEGDAAQVSLWLAECHLLAGEPETALRLLDDGADDESVAAARLRATATWLAGPVTGGVAALHAAYRRSVDEAEAYERVCLAEVLAAADSGAEALAHEVAPLRTGLGIVRLAVLPGR